MVAVQGSIEKKLDGKKCVILSFDKVVKRTDKAVLIRFNNGNEVWVPSALSIVHEREKRVKLPIFIAKNVENKADNKAQSPVKPAAQSSTQIKAGQLTRTQIANELTILSTQANAIVERIRILTNLLQGK